MSLLAAVRRQFGYVLQESERDIESQTRWGGFRTVFRCCCWFLLSSVVVCFQDSICATVRWRLSENKNGHSGLNYGSFPEQLITNTNIIEQIQFFSSVGLVDVLILSALANIEANNRMYNMMFVLPPSIKSSSFNNEMENIFFLLLILFRPEWRMRPDIDIYEITYLSLSMHSIQGQTNQQITMSCSATRKTTLNTNMR